MQVRDVYNPHKPVTMLPMDMRLKEMKKLMMRTRESFFPVVDEEIRLVGILSFPELRAILFEEALSELIVVGDLVEKPVAIGLNETLYEALIKFISSGYGQIPILKEDRPGRLTGVLSLEELMEAYHQEMLRLEQG
jgi:CIC family chloride channel protein